MGRIAMFHFIISLIIIMFKFFVVAVLAVAVSALTKQELDTEWEIYKTQHNKKYNRGEEVIRRGIWEYHLGYIQKHNLEADRGVHTFWLGMNEYGDMSNDEFVKVMNGYRMRNTTQRFGSTYLPPSHVGDLPDTGQCGSCWSFSATGSLEGQHFKKNKTLTSLSEQNLVDCSKKQGMFDNPTAPKHKNGECKFDAANVGATDTGFVDIKSKSESDLQSAVATVGPISVAIDASHMSFQLYRSGVYHSFFCSETRLDHGVLAVGYGTDSGKDYWLVKN
ncbi:hypothetical protein KUTeg_000963, partial [Tegillarca granosa]